MTRSRLLALAFLVPAALGFSAAPARADGETLSLVQNDPTAVVGRATNYTASGTLNPADTYFGFDVYIFEKDADRDPTCAATLEAEEAAASSSGGNEAWISPAGGFAVGTGPAFSQPFKITFTGSGTYLLCGYVHSDFDTRATAQLSGTVQPDPTVTPTPTPPALPVALQPPSITRRGHVLTCHPGRWSNAPTRLSYRWSRGAKTVGSRRTLSVHRALRGRLLTCRVTAQNAAGAATAYSRPVRAR
jgi:hypothetical protein